MYTNGQGVPQDDAEAVRWLRKAAEQGIAPAQIVLASNYALGLGVPQDYIQAHMWYNLAASRLTAGTIRDDAINARDSIAELMTPAQVSEAQKLAREWKPKK